MTTPSYTVTVRALDGAELQQTVITPATVAGLTSAVAEIVAPWADSRGEVKVTVTTPHWRMPAQLMVKGRR